jgi:integrase
MTRVRLKYLHCFTDRHGKPRCFFRYRGQRWPLPLPGTEGFATAYDGLLAHIKANPFRGRNNVEFMPGSLGWAIEKFLQSPLYNKRAETTKRNYRRILDQLRDKYGTGLLDHLKPRHVRTMRNEIAKTSTTAADIAMSLISALWNFAVEQLGVELDADPTHGIPRVHEVKHEHEPWPQELIERFLREARPSLRWAVKLALYTGQRRSDLVKMKWSEFDGEFIQVRQQKTGALVSIPCHKELRAELESMPRVAETILVGERGVPVSSITLAATVRTELRKMGVDGYSIHGLRKNAAVALADAGCDAFEIASITGHRSTAMVAHYAKRHDQRRRARSAMDKWESAAKSTITSREGSGKPKNVARN